MSNSFQQLSSLTLVAADTADYNAIKKYDVTEATTNPTIILQAAILPQYQHHLEQSAEYGIKSASDLELAVENAMDMLVVSFGERILQVVSKKVHVQVDPRLAFDTQRSVSKALKLLKMFEDKGIDRRKVVIKLPATWEGIRAAGILEKTHGVSCNMTTMFSLVQAAACAEAGVSYLAPFVGRINMWHEENGSEFDRAGETVLKNIQNYMRKFGYKTKVMGAYFVNSEQIKAVSGCDFVTAPLSLIDALIKDKEVVDDKMDSKLPVKKLDINEDTFRFMLNEDQMATSLLSEIIRNFSADYGKLKNIVRKAILRKK
ncbi:unnamed protein product [Phyllotreta striolata]|uniref:transaldolase n=1 Tax=Phyllotreta striolata TaxID=444603 RepID=A0A9N9TIG5_PHYSR|nr:unnamed protein product [Phyllotreta striolata]